MSGEQQPESTDVKKPSGDTPRPSIWKRRRFTILALVGVAAVIVGVLWSQAGEFFTNMKAAEAMDHLEDGELDAALEKINEAIEDDDERQGFYFRRARIYLAMSEDEGRDRIEHLKKALDDLDTLLEMNHSFRRGYHLRAEVYQRLREHQKAVADADEAATWAGQKNLHVAYNSQAYIRARGKVELEKAVKLADKAVAEFDLARLTSDEEYRREQGATAAQYLDTRGFAYYQVGRNSEALADLNLAIELAEENRKQRLEDAEDQPESERKSIQKKLDENLAVMLYHRGRVHERLGNADAAETDKKKGVKLGYDEAKGIF